MMAKDPMSRGDRRRGAVLLEAVLALALLGVAASAGAWSAAELMRAVARSREAEHDARAAARFLTAVSLWPREDLDRHLGRSAQGPWDLLIDRASRTLYLVRLADTADGRVVLRTALYRPIEGQ